MTDLFAALLKGTPVQWRQCRMSPEEFVHACTERGVTSLVDDRLRNLPSYQRDWPCVVFDRLATTVRAQTAVELLSMNELVAVLDVLSTEGLDAILMKGTALAYGLYDNPVSRPRIDCDLLIRRTDIDAARRAMAAVGYAAPAYCDGELLFHQFPMQKTDRFGVGHTFDFHWKISTQSVFADMLSFDEISAAAIALPALGPHARATGLVHALLLACIHPVMHHRNAESLIWAYDIHLIACRLSETEFERFADLAVSKHVSAICAHQLNAAYTWFGTPIPAAVWLKLSAVLDREPSAAYLRRNRSWADEIVSSLGALPRWRDRLGLAREVMFPGSDYMLKTYSLSGSWLGRALLPALYLHRLASGCWKIFVGRK